MFDIVVLPIQPLILMQINNYAANQIAPVKTLIYQMVKQFYTFEAMLKKLIFILFLCVTNNLFAQNYQVNALVIDDKSEPVVGANVLLQSFSDSLKKYTTLTNIRGEIQFNNIPNGYYALSVRFVGYNPLKNKRVIVNGNTNVGVLKLETASTNLREAKVEGEAVRAEILKDTIQYNANAFKVNRDATAEDLVRKMPGVTIENGTVKTQGEEVKKVLVDGKEFFGDDPMMALRNMPAEVVDKMQVFDRLSEQSQFTRFDDGKGEKTINLTSKRGKANGVFGKIFGGYGTDNRYNAGASVNAFKGNRRITILAMVNNINQQNFSFQDIIGISGNSGRMQGSMGSAMMRSGAMQNPANMRWMPGSESMGNFMVNQQSGISSTNAIGTNYTNVLLNNKLNIQGSYFFNKTNTQNEGSVNRNFFSPGLNGQYYKENNKTQSNNNNHRFNLRLQYDIDSNNKIIYTPRLTIQQNNSFSSVSGEMRDNSGPINTTGNNQTNNNTAINFSNNLLWQHRFIKYGRTFSAAIDANYNNRDGNSTLNAATLFAGVTDSSFSFDQISKTITNGTSYGVNLTYTEPIGKYGMLQLNYNPSANNNYTEKLTYNKPAGGTDYIIIDTLLSNKFDNVYTRHRGGLSYQFNNDVYNLTVGSDVQVANLSGNQQFPFAFKVSRDFKNVLPNFNLNIKPNKEVNLRFIYRTATNIPTIQQLQEVIDNSNAVQLNTGNTKLDQSFSHTAIARMALTRAGGTKTMFFVNFANFNQNFIANQTIIPVKDSTIFVGNDSLRLRRGTQLSRPVNLNGNVMYRSFLNYGFPFKAIKSNINLSLGYVYQRSPGLINNTENITNTHALNGGFVLGSNISENTDFTVSYNNSYNIVKNNIRPELDNNYYNQTVNAKLNLVLRQRFVLNTDISHILFTGLEQSFNQQFLLWNAAIGYKFLKNKQGDLRLSVFDLLNQNNNVSRNVTETFIEDQRNLIIRQYFMLTFTYNLRYFKL